MRISAQFSNIIWLFFDKLIRLVGGLLVITLLARYLGPEDFGLLNFSLAYIAIFSAIATLGLKDIVIRELTYHPEEKNNILGSTFFLSVLGSIICYLLMVVTVHLLRPNDLELISILIVLGMTIFFKPADVVSFWFESQTKSKYSVIAQNISFLIFALVKILLIISNAPLNLIIYAILGEAILLAFLLLCIFLYKTDFFSKLSVTKQKIKHLFKNGWPVLLSSIAIILYMRVDQIMLGQLASNYQVGIYSAASRISEVFYFIPSIIVISFFPKLLKLKKGQPEEYNISFQAVLDTLVLISLPVVIFFTVFGDNVVQLLFGKEFLQSSDVLIIHIWASIPVFLGFASTRWLIAAGLQKIIFIKTICACILNIILNILLIPGYGAIGAAIATVISQCVVTFVLDFFFPPAKQIFIMKLKTLNIFTSIYRLYKHQISK